MDGRGICGLHRAMTRRRNEMDGGDGREKKFRSVHGRRFRSYWMRWNLPGMLPRSTFGIYNHTKNSHKGNSELEIFFHKSKA